MKNITLALDEETLAAASSGCVIVHSENLNPGQTIQGVRIENPLG
jgi:hypothetical protein